MKAIFDPALFCQRIDPAPFAAWLELFLMTICVLPVPAGL